jgi:hypothetical protein
LRAHDPPETTTGCTGVDVGACEGALSPSGPVCGGGDVAALPGEERVSPDEDDGDADEPPVAIGRPWKVFAAINASAPESATAPKTRRRVTDEIRRSPAFRAVTALSSATSRGIRVPIGLRVCTPRRKSS